MGQLLSHLAVLSSLSTGVALFIQENDIPQIDNQSAVVAAQRGRPRREERFPSWGEFPEDVGTLIIEIAACQSQATYRALRLTSSKTNSIVLRRKCLRRLPIYISERLQIQKFWRSLTRYAGLAHEIRILWIQSKSSDRADYNSNTGLIIDVIKACPQLEALACPFPTWTSSISSRHTNLKYLALLPGVSQIWPLQQPTPLPQLERLHVLSDRYLSWQLQTLFPATFPNLRQCSLSAGNKHNLLESHSTMISRFQNAPQVKKVAIISKLYPARASRLARTLEQTFGTKVTLHHCPRRYTEMKIFSNAAFDEDNIWKLGSGSEVREGP